DVHDVDAPGGDRLVGEAVVQARGRRVGKPVRGLQPRPAVGPADELLRQAELEAGALREVRERADAERLRAVLPPRQPLAVVEPEPHRYAEALRGEPPVELAEPPL